jgi:thiamine kinase-like enzyme
VRARACGAAPSRDNALPVLPPKEPFMPPSNLPPPEAERIRALPLWTAPVAIEPLGGGITNRNFLVADPQKGRFVVRFGDDIPLHGVMRFNELAAARAAHAAGLSPEVVHAQPGILVTRCISGLTLSPEAVREPDRLARIVDLVRRCHRDVAGHLRGPVLAFWVFHVIRSYIGTLRDDDSRIVPLLPRLARLAEILESSVGAVEIVFAHNDLLAANFIDDGERLWLIDWDYAGFNAPLFDLANLCSNNDLDEAQERCVLRRYFGDEPSPSRLAAFEAMKCASLLREALWSAVSEIHSNLAFDFVAYTEDYLARLDRAVCRIGLSP